MLQMNHAVLKSVTTSALYDQGSAPDTNRDLSVLATASILVRVSTRSEHVLRISAYCN